MRRLGSLAAIIVAGLASSAIAQPSATDLGNLGVPGTIDNAANAISPAGVVWYNFTLTSAITAAGRTYLDIDTASSNIAGGTFPNDTMIAVYDNTGTGILADDDSGPGFTSGLSFGIGSNQPLGGVGGATSTGGPDLAAGTYYLAVTGYPATFFINGWNVTSTHGHSGTLGVHFATGSIPPATAPTSTNLGNVGIPATVEAACTLAGADVQWFRFNLTAAVNASSFNYLEIYTGGGLDTMLGLYTNAGDRVAIDDDSGPAFLSGLSFGAGSGDLLGGAGGVASTGQHGATLATGTYYIAVTGFGGTNFGLHDWNVTSTHAQAGDAPLTIRTGAQTPPDGWIQQGTPGNLPGTAQVCTGSGTLTAINGNIAASAEAHMYRIAICDPGNFSASTVNGRTAGDTQLFLFRLDGTGIVMDDDDPTGAGGLLSRLSNAFTASLAAGDYLIAISRYNADPRDSGGQLLWNNTPFNAERAPDGPGASNPVASWAGASGTGSYRIELTGACYAGGGTHCPADLNNDGGVDISDLVVFLVAFEAGDASVGDLDNGTRTGTQDGAVDINDLVYFLIRFEDGC